MKDANANSQEVADFYAVLKKLGYDEYDKNQKRRKQGWVRFVPSGKGRPALDMTWAEYQEKLFKEGYRYEPPINVKNPEGFCAELTKDIDTKAWVAKT